MEGIVLKLCLEIVFSCNFFCKRSVYFTHFSFLFHHLHCPVIFLQRFSPHPVKYSDLKPFRCTVPFSLTSVRYFSQNDQFRSALAQLPGQVPLRFQGYGAAVHSFRFPRSSAAKSQCMCSVAHIFK